MGIGCESSNSWVPSMPNRSWLPGYDLLEWLAVRRKRRSGVGLLRQCVEPGLLQPQLGALRLDLFNAGGGTASSASWRARSKELFGKRRLFVGEIGLTLGLGCLVRGVRGRLPGEHGRDHRRAER
jgi:hypothetical protein